MTSPQPGSGKKQAVAHVTTDTGRILRVDAEGDLLPDRNPVSSAPASVDMDPARRTDVLFRVRRAQGQEVSAWWMIGAFLVTSTLVVVLLRWVPGGA